MWHPVIQWSASTALTTILQQESCVNLRYCPKLLEGTKESHECSQSLCQSRFKSLLSRIDIGNLSAWISLNGDHDILFSLSTHIRNRGGRKSLVHPLDSWDYFSVKSSLPTHFIHLFVRRCTSVAYIFMLQRLRFSRTLCFGSSSFAKRLPRSASFRRPRRWKLEGAKSGL